jgi:hypothetical protein
MKLVELYFENPRNRPGQCFLGAVLMKAEEVPDDTAAIAWRAWRMGVNPGGQLLLFDRDSEELAGFTDSHLDRLLTEGECLGINLFKKRKETGRGVAWGG